MTDAVEAENYALESHARFLQLLQSLAAEHHQLCAHTQDMARQLTFDGYPESSQGLHSSGLHSSGYQSLTCATFGVPLEVLANRQAGAKFSSNETKTSGRSSKGVRREESLPSSLGPVFSVHSKLSEGREGERLVLETEPLTGQDEGSEHSGADDLLGWTQVETGRSKVSKQISTKSEEAKLRHSTTLDRVSPAILHRLQARIGVLSWHTTTVTHLQLFAAARSLGLEKYSAHDMQRLVSHMKEVSGTDPEEEDMPRYKKVLSRLGSSLPNFDEAPGTHALRRISTTSAASATTKAEERNIEFKIFAEFIVSDTARQKLGIEFQAMSHTLKEVFLSGDANRLVAELTSVRVDDLAAPPPRLDWDTFFEPLVGLVILLNGVAIGVQTDASFQEWNGWVWVEGCFTLFFLLEMLVRMYCTGVRQYFFGQDRGWALLDVSIVFMGLVDFALYLSQEEVDVGTLTIIRTFRMARVTRLFQIFRLSFLRELNIMVKGLLAGMKTLAWAIVLLFFTIYLIAVLSTHTLGKRPNNAKVAEEELFTSVPRSMLTCFRCFVGDCTTSEGFAIVKLMSDAQGLPFVFGYLCSFTIVTLGLFNLIMALYVEITMAAAKRTEETDKFRRERESLRIAHITKKLLKKFCVAQQLADPRQTDSNELAAMLKLSDDQDLDADMTISKELFLLIVQDPEVQKLMNELDIPPDRATLFEVLDADGTGDLHVTELVHGLLKIRGEARKSDIIASLLAVRAVQEMLRLLEKKVLANQKKMMEQMGISKKERTVSIWDLNARKLSHLSHSESNSEPVASHRLETLDEDEQLQPNSPNSKVSFFESAERKSSEDLEVNAQHSSEGGRTII